MRDRTFNKHAVTIFGVVKNATHQMNMSELINFREAFNLFEFDMEQLEESLLLLGLY